MTTDRIFNLIETIAATPGKNDKVALLRAHQHDMDLPEILFLAYNPFYTYGVRSLPEATPQAPGGCSWTWSTEVSPAVQPETVSGMNCPSSVRHLQNSCVGFS